MSAPVANRAMLLTPPGAGAIGVVRVAGPDALWIVDEHFRSKSGRSLADAQCARLMYGWFVVRDETIDDVIVSRTTNHNCAGVDISAHGGVRVLERILEALGRSGAGVEETQPSPADIWPAENLIEREAIEALGRCKTRRAVRFAAYQYSRLTPALRKLAETYPTDRATGDAALQSMLAGFDAGQALLDGVTVAIVGPPNSGKSTLFNRFLGRHAAVVSERAGTTRDWVSEAIEIDGVPISLVDTAGSHETTDTLEQRAIRRSTVAGSAATLRLVVLDGSCPLPPNVDRLVVGAGEQRSIVAVNKTDQPRAWAASEWVGKGVAGDAADPIELSAVTGTGIDRLTRRIVSDLGLAQRCENRPWLFTSRQRQYAAEILGAEDSGLDRLLSHLSGLIGEFHTGDPPP